MADGALNGVTIVFDLDGTLVDTAPDIANAIARTFESAGFSAPSLDEVRDMIGGGSTALVRKALELKNIQASENEARALTEAFFAHYLEDVSSQSQVYDGVAHVLKTLRDEGAMLAVCTNKRTDLSIKLLVALGLAHHFSVIFGSDRALRKKPDPQHYIAAVEAAGGRLAHSFMVGDSKTDVAAARGAGAPIAIMRFGYNHGQAEMLGADMVFSNYDELLPWCRRTASHLLGHAT